MDNDTLKITDAERIELANRMRQAIRTMRLKPHRETLGDETIREFSAFAGIAGLTATTTRSQATWQACERLCGSLEHLVQGLELAKARTALDLATLELVLRTFPQPEPVAKLATPPAQRTGRDLTKN